MFCYKRKYTRMLVKNARSPVQQFYMCCIWMGTFELLMIISVQGCWFHVHDEKSYLSQSETLAPAVVLLPFSCGGKMSKGSGGLQTCTP